MGNSFSLRTSSLCGCTIKQTTRRIFSCDTLDSNIGVIDVYRNSYIFIDAHGHFLFPIGSALTSMPVHHLATCRTTGGTALFDAHMRSHGATSRVCFLKTYLLQRLLASIWPVPFFVFSYSRFFILWLLLQMPEKLYACVSHDVRLHDPCTIFVVDMDNDMCIGLLCTCTYTTLLFRR